jgi:aminomethyltransferase
MKHTPLDRVHRALGARMVEFGGWEMPVFYTSILDEHQAVRTAAGLFDISHMGEVRAKGETALEFLNGVLTNDLRKLQPGQGQYTFLCNPRGGVIDDLYAYRLDHEEFLLVINAGRIDADVSWLEQQFTAFAGRGRMELKNVSHDFGAVAVQGPQTAQFIDDCLETSERPARSLKKNEIVRARFAGQTIFVSRTGYTGEDGFELVAPAEIIEALWNKILEVGRPFGLKPAGLGARDTLRTEVCYPLYGHELDEDTTPLDAGLGFFVALEKGEFMGRSALAKQKAEGTAKKLIAFKMVERSAPPRSHYPIWTNDQRVGDVTSGTQSPSLGIGIGMGYVPPACAVPGTPIGIEIRGRQSPAMIVRRPIYQKAEKDFQAPQSA